jgi:hypothetical protein
MPRADRRPVRYAGAMRFVLALVVLAACGAAQLPAHRPLVVDNIPYGADRAAIRSWQLAHDWCLRRAWPTTDEFVICNQQPYVNPTTPPMFTMIRYNQAGWSIAYAVFVPVPCTLQQRCDEVTGHSVVNPDYELIDPEAGLYVHLADRAREIERPDAPLPDMQQRLYDALRTEIASRCGAPTWAAPHGYGETWETKRTELGLFVSSNGAWIIETHEIKDFLRGLVVKN